MGRGHTSADNWRRRPQLGDEDVSDARKEVDKKSGGARGAVIHYYICSSPLAPEA